jgi:hypothetical protein
MLVAVRVVLANAGVGRRSKVSAVNGFAHSVADTVATTGLDRLVWTNTCFRYVDVFIATYKPVQIRIGCLVRSAKPLCVGSIPTRASKISLIMSIEPADLACLGKPSEVCLFSEYSCLFCNFRLLSYWGRTKSGRRVPWNRDDRKRRRSNSRGFHSDKQGSPDSKHLTTSTKSCMQPKSSSRRSTSDSPALSK